MKKLILLSFLILPCMLYAQQATQYSHYMFNSLPFNPAFAGSKELMSADLLYRSQWTGYPGSPETAQIDIHSPVGNKGIGAGLDLIQDKAGSEKQVSANISIAYRLKINGEDYLSFGVSGGILDYRLDYTELTTDEAGDELLTQSSNYLMPDARFGLYYSNNKYYAGFSLTNLIGKPSATSGLEKQPRVVFLTGGYLLDINSQLKLYPSFLYRGDFVNAPLTDISNFLLIKEKIWIGGSYRTSFGNSLDDANALLLLTEIYLTDQIRIGYAYDYSLMPLRQYGNGTHEFSLGYCFRPIRSSKMLSPRFL